MYPMRFSTGAAGRNATDTAVEIRPTAECGRLQRQLPENENARAMRAAGRVAF